MMTQKFGFSRNLRRSDRKQVLKTRLFDGWFGGNAVYLSKIEAGLLSDICRQTDIQYRTDTKDCSRYSLRKTSYIYYTKLPDESRQLQQLMLLFQNGEGMSKQSFLTRVTNMPRFALSEADGELIVSE
jgi:hypothetical protein